MAKKKNKKRNNTTTKKTEDTEVTNNETDSAPEGDSASEGAAATEEKKQRKNPTVKKTTAAVLAICKIVEGKAGATVRDVKPTTKDANIYEANLTDEKILARAKQLREAKAAAAKFEGLSDNQIKTILDMVKAHINPVEE